MDPSPFAGLVHDQEALAKVYLAIEAAVMSSFDEDQRRLTVPRGVRVTQSEVKRRTEVALSIFRSLRGDLGWSWQRCVDYLVPFLRKALDGEAWEPDGFSMWAPAPAKE